MNKYLYIIIALAMLVQCQEVEVRPASFYERAASFNDSSATHPNASVYQAILNNHQRQGIVGATLLVKDSQGLWVGAAGSADIASDAQMSPQAVYFIASISKVFTSAAVYRLVDRGLLSLNDPISQYLSDEIVDEVENVKDATIAHLLSHRSGIRDFYTTKFDLDRLNANQTWKKEDVIKYVYGKNASFQVDKNYEYSNTNFLLLSMALESVTGLSFEEVYQNHVFEPLNLRSAYYSEDMIVPPGAVKGYVDLYNNGSFVESAFLYKEELGIGGDGGVAINAYDLAVFLENLVDTDFISAASQSEMTNWFPLPRDYVWEEYGQDENGYGIERFNTRYESAIGHTGGIDGFSTYGFYFPESDMTYILLCNSSSVEAGDVHASLFDEVLEIMFGQ
ncbi:MAG: beta-lactamase family protein [Cyclobacteriaceae bacterium]|nr:beta-lactamase family protein [Cyclobacteriaceae bacterium HetDA_MAG_MS6]